MGRKKEQEMRELVRKGSWLASCLGLMDVLVPIDSSSGHCPQVSGVILAMSFPSVLTVYLGMGPSAPSSSFSLHQGRISHTLLTDMDYTKS